MRSELINTTRQQVVYMPQVYIVAQGSKAAYLGEECYTYDALNYLVLSVPLPLQCKVTEASQDKPYLAIGIDIDITSLNQLILEMDLPAPDNKDTINRGIFVSSMKNELLDCLVRLVKLLDDEKSAKIVGPLVVKEVMYHILRSENGDQLRAFSYQDRHSFQIAKVINYIRENYAESLDIASLADIAAMSTSSFHHYFKEVARVSPIQYIKTMRLHEAKKKMLLENLSASDASFKVGYTSPSQFSREYKRLFGETPSKDVELARMAQ